MVEANALSLLEKKLGSFSDVNSVIKLVEALEYVLLAISYLSSWVYLSKGATMFPREVLS